MPCGVNKRLPKLQKTKRELEAGAESAAGLEEERRRIMIIS
jgi:hypothetical protein